MNDNIYGIVPVEFKEDWDEKEKLKKFLEFNPNRYFKGKDLSRRCGFTNSATSVQLRKAITELVCVDKVPIVSDSAGYMYATRKKAVEYYIDNLSDRVAGIQRRIYALIEIEERMGE